MPASEFSKKREYSKNKECEQCIKKKKNITIRGGYINVHTRIQ